MTIAIPNAYDEIIDFIAAGLTPTSLIAFQPSEAAKERVAELIFREKIWRYRRKKERSSIAIWC
jgi:methylase of polypeptide subunit release factors